MAVGGSFQVLLRKKNSSQNSPLDTSTDIFG